MRRGIKHFIFALLIFFFSISVFAQQKDPGSETFAPEQTKSQKIENSLQMTDIHDIKPIEKPVIDPILLYYIFFFILALALIVAGFYSWKKFRNRKKEIILEPLSSDEAALRSLDGLSNMQDLDGKEFYFRLSAILRNYIRGRYGVNAPEMTTEEFLPRIEELGIHKGLQKHLKDLFYSIDPVKFAGMPAVESKMQKDLMFVRDFVKETAPTNIHDQMVTTKDEKRSYKYSSRNL